MEPTKTRPRGQAGSAKASTSTKVRQPKDSTTIAVESLQADDTIQQRVDPLDEAIVEEYASIAQGWPFPPVVVYRDEADRMWLADGYHRVAAAQRAGYLDIPANIRSGERRDALLYAVGTNAEHGLRRSNADKRKAVRTMLEDPEWSNYTDRAIAAYCNVHHQLVGVLRAAMNVALDESSSQPTDHDRDPEVERIPPTEPAKRKTAAGRTIDTSGITKANKLRAKAAPPSAAKSARQAMHRFAGTCADIRSATLDPGELRRVGQLAVAIMWHVTNSMPADARDEFLNEVRGGMIDG